MKLLRTSSSPQLELHLQQLSPQPTATLRLSQPDVQTRRRLNESYGKLPLSFEANQAQ